MSPVVVSYQAMQTSNPYEDIAARYLGEEAAADDHNGDDHSCCVGAGCALSKFLGARRSMVVQHAGTLQVTICRLPQINMEVEKGPS